MLCYSLGALVHLSWVSKVSGIMIMKFLDFDKIFGPAKSWGMLYWDDGESIVRDFKAYDYFHWIFEFVLTSQRATLYITAKHTSVSFSDKTLQTVSESLRKIDDRNQCCISHQ